MENQDAGTKDGMAVDFNDDVSKTAPQPSADERLQKILDRALYADGSPEAQKLRNFLNGTWLGEPLHVVLTDPSGHDTKNVTKERQLLSASSLMLSQPERE